LLDVHTHSGEELSARLRQRVRAKDGWSVDVLPACLCSYGAASFVVSCGTGGTTVRVTARDGSASTHPCDHRLARSPVSHVTRRGGRPFTLVLTKTDALFEREAAERARRARDLEWLTRVAGFPTTDGC
jgi:hypothetical protein